VPMGTEALLGAVRCWRDDTPTCEATLRRSQGLDGRLWAIVSRALVPHTIDSKRGYGQ
jgi:DNA polymerase IIIc chi subunit